MSEIFIRSLSTKQAETEFQRLSMLAPETLTSSVLLPTGELLYLTREDDDSYSVHLAGPSLLMPYALLEDNLPASVASISLALYSVRLLGASSNDSSGDLQLVILGE